MAATSHTASPQRRSWYVVSIWAERQSGRAPVWRGLLETVDGQRRYFTTLNELNRLLSELGGWADPASVRRTVEPDTSP